MRDAGALAAAAGRPRTTVFGDDAYPTFNEKVAALLRSLVRNHALVDGNKRLAWARPASSASSTVRIWRTPSMTPNG
ncbi:MAG: Fic family protein [Egibacteraceae bacterium]